MNDGAIKDFVESIKTDTEKVNKIYSAIVARVDAEGVVWVNLAGSDKETPTASTSAEVKSGDVVTVQWRNNKLYIAGNYSNPSAGVIRVQAVESAANTAREAAANAVADAGRAREAAEDATATANSVHDIAVQAQTDAAAVKQNLQSVVQGATTVEKAVSVMQTAMASIIDYDPNTTQETFTGDGTETDFALQTEATDILSVMVDGEAVEYTSAVVSDVTVVTIDPAPADEAEISITYEHATTQEWFWHDSSGAHVLGDTSGYRTDLKSTGMDVVEVANETSVAQFGVSGVRIGDEDGAHTIIDENGMQIYSIDDNDTLVQLANIGYGEGMAGVVTTAIAPYYTFGIRKTSNIQYDSSSVYSIGDLCIYNNQLYVCHQDIETPEAWNRQHWMLSIGNHSVAEGRNTIAGGPCSHAEGNYSVALGISSHAEGDDAYYYSSNFKPTMALNIGTHAEGGGCVASGMFSHAEGNQTLASESAAHAEGCETVASAFATHAQNVGTIASNPGQTAMGIYNIEDTGSTSSEWKALIIGNGTDDDHRSNALTVDWDGNVDASGGITTGGDVDVTGDVVASGAVTCSNIGAYKSHVPDAVSCATGKYFQVAHLELTKGTWLLDANATFDAINGTGIRAIRITTATSGYNNVTSPPPAVGTIAIDSQPAANATLYPQVHLPVVVSSTTTYRLCAFQNSGSSGNVTGRMYATRIK